MSSPRFAIPSPAVILEQWTLLDLLDAHATLDMFDELERKARQP